MEITEVRVKLMEDSDDRLQAFCSITFDDCFVVRDLKIIEGSNGPFVAMPSRKLTFHCPQCGSKNHLRSSYCNHCGSRLKEERLPRDADGRTKLYADIAHPINSTCREMIQQRVIAEFKGELERYQQPGYVSRYDEDYQDEVDAERDEPPKPDSASSIPARADVQPAEREPRPPHQAKAHQAKAHQAKAHVPPAERPSQEAAPPREMGTDDREDGFGAGIFEK